jgi:hypothetical protein
MTMHLVQGMTSLNTKKNKKRKLTLSKIAKFQEQMFAHNKAMRRKGLHDLQMDLQEFIDYCHGDWKPKAQKSAADREFKPLKSANGYVRETENIPSLSNNVGGIAPKKAPQEYTGTLIKGIATMHKSNAVPIIDKQQAKDIASMRR